MSMGSRLIQFPGDTTDLSKAGERDFLAYRGTLRQDKPVLLMQEFGIPHKMPYEY